MINTEARWRVVRQDDHGNRFVVAEGLTRVEAETQVAELTARAHKQTYWCEAIPEIG